MIIYGDFHSLGGTPKWLVYKANPIEMDDLGVPPFMETSIYLYYLYIILYMMYMNKSYIYMHLYIYIHCTMETSLVYL